MSFATRPKPDREAMWVHCQMHHSRMGHTTTNRGLAVTGTASFAVGQGLGRGNTTIPFRGDYLIAMGVQRTTVAGLAGGSVATGSITVPEVIDDCMSLQRTNSSEDETEPPATHGHKIPNLWFDLGKCRIKIMAKNSYIPCSLNPNKITKVDPHVGLFVNHIGYLFECDFVSLDSRLQSKKSAMDSSFTLGSTEKVDNFKILQSCNGLLLCIGSGRPVFYYVYNPSTNHFKKLSHPDCSLDNSPYYRSDGLRMAFDPTKSSHYKLVDAGRTSCDIDIEIYSSETGN
ncbi:hypothetical protein Tco_0432551 [Tanacetum coccineum]